MRAEKSTRHVVQRVFRSILRSRWTLLRRRGGEILGTAPLGRRSTPPFFVLRVVVIREPFSWFVSKHLWHSRPCDDFSSTELFANQGWPALSVVSTVSLGGRLNFKTVEEEEEACWMQAEDNLRNSFAVVGLSHELNIFLDMVTELRGIYQHVTRP